MFDMKTFKMARLTTFSQEKGRGCSTAIRNFKEQYKPVFINCAVTFMAIKLGLISLATFATMAYFLSPAARLLAIETSRPKARQKAGSPQRTRRTLMFELGRLRRRLFCSASFQPA